MDRSRSVVVALFAMAGTPLMGTLPTKVDPVKVAATRGQAALEAGQYAEALKVGSLLAAKYPNRYEGHRLVARAALSLDQPDKADAAFRQALRFAPPPQRPSLQSGLKEAGRLREALRQTAYARSLKATGDTGAAAKAEESAYRTFPQRAAFAIAAADLFEAAGLFGDAHRLLSEVRASSPRLASDESLNRRIATLQARIDAAEREATETDARRATEARKAEAKRKAVEAARQAKAAEEKRIEDERRAEEERQRAEKIRADQAEMERLNGVLNDLKRSVDEAESAVRSTEDRIGDAERSVRRLDGEADGARSRRDAAKREKDDIQDKLRDAKGDLAKQLYREQLRTAEGKHSDAKEEYERIDRRLDDAKSKRDTARSDAEAARQRLEKARQGIRETEAAIQRIANGG